MWQVMMKTDFKTRSIPFQSLGSKFLLYSSGKQQVQFGLNIGYKQRIIENKILKVKQILDTWLCWGFILWKQKIIETYLQVLGFKSHSQKKKKKSHSQQSCLLLFNQYVKQLILTICTCFCQVWENQTAINNLPQIPERDLGGERGM